MGTPTTSSQGPPSLNRWLNINLVPRDVRSRGYMLVPTDQMPALSGPIVWNGHYSVKVAQFNIHVDDNFSIVGDMRDSSGVFILPMGDNILWTLSIYDVVTSDRTGYNAVKRYRLNSASGGTIDVVGDYMGEVITAALYNLSFEGWTVPASSGRISAYPPVGVNTSLLSRNADIRYGGPSFAVDSTGGGHVNFLNTSVSSLNSFALPMTFPDYVFQANL